MKRLAHQFAKVNQVYHYGQFCGGGVPAHWGEGKGGAGTLVLRNSRGPLPSLPNERGHPVRAGELFKHWDHIFALLTALAGSNQRAEMCRYVLRLQALCGRAFPSARMIASAAFASEKTWDRCLARLRAQGLARTQRLWRPNGEQSVNLIDLAELWQLLLKLLVDAYSKAERVGRSIWVKVGGAWRGLGEFCLMFPEPVLPEKRGLAT